MAEVGSMAATEIGTMVAAEVGRVAAINIMLQQTHDKLTQTLQHMYVCVNLPCANVRFEGQVI